MIEDSIIRLPKNQMMLKDKSGSLRAIRIAKAIKAIMVVIEIRVEAGFRSEYERAKS